MFEEKKVSHYYEGCEPPKYNLMNDQAMHYALADMQSEFDTVHLVDITI